MLLLLGETVQQEQLAEPAGSRTPIQPQSMWPTVLQCGTELEAFVNAAVVLLNNVSWLFPHQAELLSDLTAHSFISNFPPLTHITHHRVHFPQIKQGFLMGEGQGWEGGGVAGKKIPAVQISQQTPEMSLCRGQSHNKGERAREVWRPPLFPSDPISSFEREKGRLGAVTCDPGHLSLDDADSENS